MTNLFTAARTGLIAGSDAIRVTELRGIHRSQLFLVHPPEVYKGGREVLAWSPSGWLTVGKVAGERPSDAAIGAFRILYGEGEALR